MSVIRKITFSPKNNPPLPHSSQLLLHYPQISMIFSWQSSLLSLLYNCCQGSHTIGLYTKLTISIVFKEKAYVMKAKELQICTLQITILCSVGSCPATYGMKRRQKRFGSRATRRLPTPPRKTTLPITQLPRRPAASSASSKPPGQPIQPGAPLKLLYRPHSYFWSWAFRGSC